MCGLSTQTSSAWIVLRQRHLNSLGSREDSRVNKPLIAFSYRATVQTKKDEWIEVKVPLDKFEANSFGRIVKDAGVVKPEEVNGVGFLLSDKKAGPFKMELEWIKVVR